MEFGCEIEERSVLDNWAADRPTKLVADQVIFLVGKIGEPAVRRQSLNAVVFEERTVPLVGAALKYRIGHEAAGLAVLCRGRAVDHAVFLNRVGRDRGIGSADSVQTSGATQTLIVVAETFYHEVAGAAAGAVDGGTAVSSKHCFCCRLCARHQTEELVLAARFERHVRPDLSINGLR